MEKNKVEGKYKTLSKANGDAVADIEYFKSENKKLRNQLHEASTSKTSEQLQLRDSLAKVICVLINTNTNTKTATFNTNTITGVSRER